MRICEFCRKENKKPRAKYCSVNCYNKAWQKRNPEEFKKSKRKWYLKNKERILKEAKERYERNKEKQREYQLIKRFGIDSKTYNEMFDSQNGKCAICRKEPEDETLSVDHNHKTGKVRALLCRSCNIGLGCFNENIELMKKGIEYLDENKTI